MAPEQQVAPKQVVMVLPSLIFGPSEIRRLQREIEALDEYFKQSEVRAPGQQPKLPVTSRLLTGLATDNKINLLDSAQRTQLAGFLELVIRKAPVLHISFAVDPSSAFMIKIVAWVRANIHPDALIQLGLQPNISVGCSVRTPNHWFDFSLANRFKKSQAMLTKLLVEGEKA